MHSPKCSPILMHRLLTRHQHSYHDQWQSDTRNGSCGCIQGEVSYSQESWTTRKNLYTYCEIQPRKLYPLNLTYLRICLFCQTTKLYSRNLIRIWYIKLTIFNLPKCLCFVFHQIMFFPNFPLVRYIPYRGQLSLSKTFAVEAFQAYTFVCSRKRRLYICTS